MECPFDLYARPVVPSELSQFILFILPLLSALALSVLHHVVARSLSSVDVKNLPGDTALMRTPLFAYSIASDLVAALSAPFVREANTAGTLLIGWSTRLVVIVTTWPRPCLPINSRAR